jgi:hypothetical protein
MLDARIELILLLTGLATSGALLMFLAPATTMKILFGKESSDTLSLLIARHWGLLVFLIGILLIYAAYHPEIRVPTLIVAIVEKVAFSLCVLISPLRGYRTTFVVALADAGMAAVYLIYLAGV